MPCNDYQDPSITANYCGRSMDRGVAVHGDLYCVFSFHRNVSIVRLDTEEKVKGRRPSSCLEDNFARIQLPAKVAGSDN